MQIPRISIVCLGVSDLNKATHFYSKVLGTPPNTSNEGISFIELPGTWLSLFPLEELARDISPEVPTARLGFSGFTLAYNARSREQVSAILELARSAGGRIVKDAQDTFWGGFSGYFTDLDGYYWEVAWGPMFEFTPDGALKPGK
jgi:catechol 2,3-dioxygenase-like lactoylglutathione lyase family enzyme